MKKQKLLAVILALVMTLSILPTAALAGEAQAVPVSGELSGDYSLTADTTLTGTITVPAGSQVTITGNDSAKLIFSGTNIIEVKGTLTLKNVVVEATSTPGYGAICLTGDGAQLHINDSNITQNCVPTGNGYSASSQIIQIANTAGPGGNAGLESILIDIKNSTLNAASDKTGVRGICFCDATSGTVSLDNTKLYCNGGTLRSSYTRGFSTYQVASARTLNINISKNSEIKGFAYPVLAAGTAPYNGHIELNASDSVFSGWSCVEAYGNSNKLNYRNCTISGCNIFTNNPSNGYFLFQASYGGNGSSNIFTLDECKITATTLNDSTAEQGVVCFDDDSSVINFCNGTTISHQDNRTAMFQLWDSDGGADASNAKQITFDDSVSITNGDFYFTFVNEAYNAAEVYRAPAAKVYQGDTGIFTYAPTLNDAVTNAENGDTIVLIDDTDKNVTIPAGKTLTLDLNRHNIAVTSGCAIVNKGTATIQGSGIVSTTASGNAAIANFPGAVCTVNGGTYKSQNWYVIKNMGTMTFDGAATVTTDSDANPSSLIDNGWASSTDVVASESVIPSSGSVASLYIKSGEFSGASGQSSCSVVKNDDYGVLVIDGGTFNSSKNDGSSNATTIMNWNKATINGGTFIGSYPLSNGNYGAADVGDLTINGGDFTGVSTIFGQNEYAVGDAGKVTVTGGKFSAPLIAGESYTYSIEISNGLFKTAPDSKYIASGKSVVPSGNSSYPYTVGIAVSGVSLDKTTATIAVGENATLTAAVAPESATNKSVNWASSNTSVATVSGGTVTGVKPGTATITVTTVDGSKTATCEVTVLDKFAVTYETELDTEHAPENQTVVDGDVVTLPELSAEGYTFAGWKSGETVYQPGYVTVHSAMTFVAQWNKAVEDIETPDEVDKVEVSSGAADVAAPVTDGKSEEEAAAMTQTTAALKESGAVKEEGLADVAEALVTEELISEAAAAAAKNEDFQAILETAGEGTKTTIVLESYMEIAVTDATVEDGKAVVTVEITPMVKVKATTNSANMIEDGASKNTVTLETKELTVTETVTITLPLPTVFGTNPANLFVKHASKLGTFYYKPDEGKLANNVVQFENPHGFSEFTLISDSRTATVNFNGTSKTLTPADVGADLSGNYTVPSGKRFDGCKFENIDGIYTTLTDELLTALAAQAGTIVAEPVFSNRFSGGSSGSSSYSVSVSSGKHGEVTASPKTASKGTTVTLTVKPDKGYELDKLTVTDKNGDTVKLTKKSDTQYTFTMPASKITVKAEFVEIEKAPAHAFTDVADGFWAEDAIAWAFEKGYMNGTSDTTFNPGGNVSRQQLWMILARVSGQNPANMAEAKSWAVVDNGISDGTAPGGSVTRQQMVAILYRYATLMGYDVSAKADLGAYPDAASVAGYAKDAMAWSVANGIVGGTTQGTLNPAGTASRAQFAVILNRFCEKMA